MITIAPNTLIVPVAPAARGKSTLARGITATVLSSDGLRGQWCPSSPCRCTGTVNPGCPGGESCRCQNARVFPEINRLALIALTAGQTVLIDATNLNADDRKNYLDVAHAAGVPAIALLAAPLSLEDLLERNAARTRQVPAPAIENMVIQHADITTKTLLEEGFSLVYTWDDDTRIEVAP